MCAREQLVLSSVCHVAVFFRWFFEQTKYLAEVDEAITTQQDADDEAAASTVRDCRWVACHACGSRVVVCGHFRWRSFRTSRRGFIDAWG